MALAVLKVEYIIFLRKTLQAMEHIFQAEKKYDFVWYLIFSKMLSKTW